MDYPDLPKLIPSSDDSEFLVNPPTWKVIPKHSFFQDLRALVLDLISCKTQTNGYTKV